MGETTEEEITFNIYKEGSSYYIPNPKQDCYGIGKTVEESIEDALEMIPEDLQEDLKIDFDAAKSSILSRIKNRKESVCDSCEHKNESNCDFDNKECDLCELWFHCELFIN